MIWITGTSDKDKILVYNDLLDIKIKDFILLRWRVYREFKKSGRFEFDCYKKRNCFVFFVW